MEMLQREFLDGGVDGFLSLCADIGWEITNKLEETELYNNWVDYAEHIQWLDELVTRNTTNVVVGTFKVIHKKNPGQGYNSELEDLLQKLKVVEAFCRRFLGVRKKGIPWQENMLKSAFAQHLQGGVVWLLEKVKIMEMPGNRAEVDMEKFDVLESPKWLAFQQIVICCKEIKSGNPPPPTTGPKYGGMCESNPASGHDKVLSSSPQNNGIIHIVVEWWFISFVPPKA